MPEIRVANTTIEIEESCFMHGLIDLNIRSHDPTATLTSFQARLLAQTLEHYAAQADGFE